MAALSISKDFWRPTGVSRRSSRWVAACAWKRVFAWGPKKVALAKLLPCWGPFGPALGYLAPDLYVRLKDFGLPSLDDLSLALLEFQALVDLSCWFDRQGKE